MRQITDPDQLVDHHRYILQGKDYSLLAFFLNSVSIPIKLSSGKIGHKWVTEFSGTNLQADNRYLLFKKCVARKIKIWR